MGGVIAAVLLWINNERTQGNEERNLPRSMMRALEQALVYECGLSPSLEQDVHEAFLQVLEAIRAGLLRRRIMAVRESLRGSWAPLRPVAGCSRFLANAVHAQWAFGELWEGVLEESRVCTACGLFKVDACPERQRFRCISLDLPPDEISFSLIKPLEISALLHESYGGAKAERLDDVICAGCSLVASISKFLRQGLQGSAAALVACRRLFRLEALGWKPLDEGQLLVLCPAGSPRLQRRRSRQHRSFSIARLPRVLALHLKRFNSGAFGAVKLNTPVMYRPILELRSRLWLPTDYVLQTVISHLGSIDSGHYLAHRRWAGPLHTAFPSFSSYSYDPIAQLSLSVSLTFLRPYAYLPGTLLWRQIYSSCCNRPWIRANDDHIVHASEYDVLKFPGPYLLFYEQYHAQLHKHGR